MKKVISKEKAKKEIEEFFSNIKEKTPKEIKKIKRLAMSYNIPLKEKRKLFCKKCLTPYSGNEKIRIKKGIKSIVCGNCGYQSRWRMK
jgi:RNase P subunit RPR2